MAPTRRRPTPRSRQLLQSNTVATQWIWPAAVNRVTLERGTERDLIVWNASPKLVTAKIPAAAKSATVVDKFGRDTGEVVAQNGVYSLDLYPSSDNTDPRDPTAYLVGGDPRILVEKVVPLPTAVDAPIQVVWPRDASGIAANITGVLLQPGTTNPVPCRWDPTVRLFESVDGGPTTLVGTGHRRLMTDSGLTYPVWDWNAVDVGASLSGKSIDFWMDVNNVTTHATRYTYSLVPQMPAPTMTPMPSATPGPGATMTNTPPPTPTPLANVAAEAHLQLSVTPSQPLTGRLKNPSQATTWHGDEKSALSTLQTTDSRHLETLQPRM